MTEKRIGPWTVQSSATSYENPWIKVVDHKVLHPDGSPGQYGVVRFKHRAIGILPIDDEGFTWLVGQHRFALDVYSWECPEGGGRMGENPLDAARRELEEEVGLTAAEWTPLLECDVSNSVTDEKAVCWLAFAPGAGNASPEPSEQLSIRRISFRELVNGVLSGQIRDSLTVMMTLAAEVKALRGELPERAARAILGDAR